MVERVDEKEQWKAHNLLLVPWPHDVASNPGRPQQPQPFKQPLTLLPVVPLSGTP